MGGSESKLVLNFPGKLKSPVPRSLQEQSAFLTPMYIVRARDCKAWDERTFLPPALKPGVVFFFSKPEGRMGLPGRDDPALPPGGVFQRVWQGPPRGGASLPRKNPSWGGHLRPLREDGGRWGIGTAVALTHGPFE